MPPLAAVVVGAVAAGAAAFFIGGVALSAALAIGFTSFALGLVQLALAPDVPDFQTASARRTQTVREAVTVRRLWYGEAVMGGKLSFYEATGGNQFHHMVVTLGDAPVAPWDGMDIVWLDDTPVFPGEIDGGGNVTAGKFAGKVRIKKLLGGPAQVADADLIGEVTRLDSNFRGRGVAAVYVRVDWNADLFPNGLPKIKVLARTNTVLDTRDDVRRWTPNAALAINEYVTEPQEGLGWDATDIEEAFTDSAANVCDEVVDAKALGHAVVAVDTGDDLLELAAAGTGAPLRFDTGDRVELFLDTGGTAPGGLATGTDYYAIVERLVGANFADADATTIALSAGDYTGEAATAITAGDVDAVHGPDIRAGVKLAASYADALARTPVTITSAGTGQPVVVKTGEPRYTLAGMIESDRTPKAVLDEMLSAMAGRMPWTGGVFRILPAAFRSPTLDLDESDLMGPLTVRTRHSRRQRFNAVRGLFAPLLTLGEATDYPSVIDSGFVTADGGDTIFATRDRPFTPRAATGQRLSKIDLSRHRREFVVDFPMTLKGLRAVPGTVVRLSNARRGWVDKTFEVMQQEDAYFGGGEPKVQGVTLRLAETDATVYGFDPATDETIKPPKPVPPGGNPFVVQPPTGLTMAEELYETRDGSGVKARAVLTWMVPTDGFVDRYQLAYKLQADPDFIVRGRVTEPEERIDDIAPGLYEFKVRSTNVLRVTSAYGPVLTKNVFGLDAAPSAPQDMTISAVGGMAVLRWRLAAELDVREGGEYKVRHSPLFSGATWAASTSIAGVDGEAIDGKQTGVTLPLKPGTYLARAFDSSGIQSTTVASVTTKQATVLAYTDTDTLVEHPLWLGTHSGTAGADGILKLTNGTLVDDYGLIDSIADWDTEGGLLQSGIYDFASSFDFGSVVLRRLTVSISALVVNTLDTVDERTTLIDDWEDIDGTDTGSADAVVWARHTDDDPGGSPTWTPYDRLDSAEFDARAFQFQVRLSSTDPAYNVHVTAITVTAAEVV